MAGVPCDLKLLRRPGPGKVRLVDDLWLVLHGIEHLSNVNERLLGLPEATELALALRTYAVASVAGLVTPGGMRRLGRKDSKPIVYPVAWSAATALTEEAGIPHVTSRAIDEVLRAGEMIVRAAHMAAHYLLRDARFSREPERMAAIAAIEAAQTQIDNIGDPGPRAQLVEALSLVETELEERRDGPIAAASPQSSFRSEQALAAKLNAALAASALTAALDDLLSRSRLRPPELPRAEMEAR
jgi:hypothetical protein